MALTAPQVLAFWTEQAQMALPDRTRLKMAAEGLVMPLDFIEGRSWCLKLAKIAGGAAVNAWLREMILYDIPARSEVCLQCERLVAKYYLSGGHEIEADDLFWPVLKNFMALESHEGEEVCACRDPTKVKQGAGGPHVDRAIRSRLGRGVWHPWRTIDIHDEDRCCHPANIATAPRAVDQPYAKIYTSIQEEMKFCLSHTHNLTKADIAAALFLISVGWTSYNNESNIN